MSKPMAKKGYIHIAEYDLTQMILDKLDIDVDENIYTLSTDIEHGMRALEYKDKNLVFPPYNECLDIDTDNEVLFKPFTNVNHANYLINLFADIEDCTAVFDYTEKDDKTLNGTLKCTYEKEKPDTNTFNGVTSVSVLTTTLILKKLLEYSIFKKHIGSIFKIDNKLSAKK